MDLSTLCTVLQGCLSPDLTTRKAAEQELSKVRQLASLRQLPLVRHSVSLSRIELLSLSDRLRPLLKASLGACTHPDFSDKLVWHAGAACKR